MSSIYLQLQSTAAGVLLPQGQPISFDIVGAKSDDIDYVTNSGMVVLSEPGTYLIEWSVAADSPAPLQIGLATSTPQGTIRGGTADAPGSLTGSAVVVVTESSAVTLTLVNLSDGPLIFSNLPIVANMVIYAGASDSGGSGGDAPKRTVSIPFSSASGITCNPGLDASGDITNVSVIGCGQTSNIPVSYRVAGSTIIQIPFGTNNAQFLFSFPYNVRLVAVSGIFNNYTPIMLSLPTTIISPYVAIATQAISNTYTFDIKDESRVYPAQGYQMLAMPPQYIPNSTILTTTRTDLNVAIPAGTPFAIVGGLISLGLSPQALNAYIYMHGSMIFEIDE